MRPIKDLCLNLKLFNLIKPNQTLTLTFLDHKSWIFNFSAVDCIGHLHSLLYGELVLTGVLSQKNAFVLNKNQIKVLLIYLFFHRIYIFQSLLPRVSSFYPMQLGKKTRLTKIWTKAITQFSCPLLPLWMTSLVTSNTQSHHLGPVQELQMRGRLGWWMGMKHTGFNVVWSPPLHSQIDFLLLTTKKV